MKDTSLNLDFLHEDNGKDTHKEPSITRRRWVYEAKVSPRRHINPEFVEKTDKYARESGPSKNTESEPKEERARQPWSVANGTWNGTSNHGISNGAVNGTSNRTLNGTSNNGTMNGTSNETSNNGTMNDILKKGNLPEGRADDKSWRRDSYSKNAAPSNLERFNKPSEPMTSNSYGFMGFPEMFMFQPKQPLRQQQSADVNREINRFFRKDSPKDYNPPAQNLPPVPEVQPPPMQQQQPPPEPVHRESPRPPPRQPSPDQQVLSRPPDRSPPPQEPQREIPPITERRRPNLPEQQRRNMTSAEMRKYEQAFTDSETDRLLSQRKREEAFYQKKEEQERERRNMRLYDPWGRPGCGAPQRGDNRKMKFTEYQLDPPRSPKYHEPPLPKYPSERRMGRGRTDYDMDFSPRRRGDVLRHQEREISEKRRHLEKLEREKLMSRASWDERKNRYEKLNTESGYDTLQRQEMQIREKEQALRDLQAPVQHLPPAGMLSRPIYHNQLRAMDDFNVPRQREPEYDMGRAQSVVKKSVFIVTSQSEKPTNVQIVGYVVKSEPQTDRQFRNQEMNRRMWGHTDNLRPINFKNRSPRREPVGVFFGTNTTYKVDYDEPSQNKTPRHIERNPNKNNMILFSPFGQEGGGAPIVDSTGQRATRIQGSMNKLGRESYFESNGYKTKRLDDLKVQIAGNKARKRNAQKEFQSAAADLADKMGYLQVGNPRKNEYGFQSEKQHLGHYVAKPGPYRTYEEKMGLKQQLDAQSESLRISRALDKQSEKHLERLHMDTFSKMYGGDYGGGNMKGPDLRKQKLDSIIHNPQQTNSYYNKVLVEGDNYMYDPDGYFDQFKPRITVNSTHRNLYEFPEGNLKMNYRGRAPYAEHGSY